MQKARGSDEDRERLLLGVTTKGRPRSGSKKSGSKKQR
jgi:hypothetical protein